MGQNTRLPIGKFKQALDFEGMNVDIEEAEWMLANMIYKVTEEICMKQSIRTKTYFIGIYEGLFIAWKDVSCAE